jgi:tRNA threonylcarbamoyl adenosine modification protein (Sua5/YciO/YrdC/YwlC family)
VVVERILAPSPIGWKVRASIGGSTARAALASDRPLRAALETAGWDIVDRVAGWSANPPWRRVVTAGDPGTGQLIAALLEAGEVCAIPTDTVYGLVAALRSDGAAERLAHVKERELGNPFQVLVGGVDQALEVADLDRSALVALAGLWPGGLTVVAQRAEGFNADLGGAPSTVGVRSPADEFSLGLIERCGPLVATSANRSGSPPLTDSAEIRQAFGPEIAAVVDGGTLPATPSTVVDVTGPMPVVLREGAIPAEAVLAAWRSGGG